MCVCGIVGSSRGFLFLWALNEESVCVRERERERKKCKREKKEKGKQNAKMLLINNY